MAKRFRTAVNDDGKLPAGYFKSKWSGTCSTCGYGFEKGEVLHYVGKSVAHEHCHGTNELNAVLTKTDYAEPALAEPSYVVIGKRKPKVCPDCMIEHGVSQKECW